MPTPFGPDQRDTAAWLSSPGILIQRGLTDLGRSAPTTLQPNLDSDVSVAAAY